MRISDWSSDVCSSDLITVRIEIEVPPEQFGRGMMADRDEPALDIERRHVTRHRILKLERDQPLRAAAADEPVDFLVPQHVDPLVREQPFLKDAFGAQGVAAMDQGDVGRMVRSEEQQSELQSLMRNA